MPTIDDLSQSKYLKQADVTPDLTVVIDSYKVENLAQDGQPEDNNYCLYFKGDAKPLVLKKTNGKLISMTLGSENLDDWIGKQITLYVDPTIAFRGDIVGGIRVRYYAPQQQAPPSQFTQDNNLAPQNPPRTDDSGPLPTEPDPTIPF
jgi:hypothetical protein